MIVRKRYSSPYRRASYLVLSNAALKNKKTFIEEIERRSEHWREATYFLKDEHGVFIRFDLVDGKIKLIYKLSPITDLPYPCWESFKK